MGTGRWRPAEKETSACGRIVRPQRSHRATTAITWCVDTPITRSASRYIRSLVSVLEYRYALGAYLLAKSCVR